MTDTKQDLPPPIEKPHPRPGETAYGWAARHLAATGEQLRVRYAGLVLGPALGDTTSEAPEPDHILREEFTLPESSIADRERWLAAWAKEVNAFHHPAWTLFGKAHWVEHGCGPSNAAPVADSLRLAISNRTDGPTLQMWVECCAQLTQGDRDPEPPGGMSPLAMSPEERWKVEWTKENTQARPGDVWELFGAEYWGAHEGEADPSIVAKRLNRMLFDYNNNAGGPLLTMWNKCVEDAQVKREGRGDWCTQCNAHASQDHNPECPNVFPAARAEAEADYQAGKTEGEWLSARPKMVAKATWRQFGKWAAERYPNGAQDYCQSHGEYVGSALERALQRRAMGKTIPPGDIGIAYLAAYDAIEWRRCRPDHINSAVWARIGKARGERFGALAPDELVEDEATIAGERFFNHLAKGQRSQNEAAELVIASWGVPKAPAEEAKSRPVRFALGIQNAAPVAPMGSKRLANHGDPGKIVNHGAKGDWSMGGPDMPWPKPTKQPYLNRSRYSDPGPPFPMDDVMRQAKAAFEGPDAPGLPPGRVAFQAIALSRDAQLSAWMFYRDELNADRWRRAGVALISDDSGRNLLDSFPLSGMARVLRRVILGAEENISASAAELLAIYNAPLPPKRAELTISVDHGWD